MTHTENIQRVEANTPPEVNERIRARTEQSITETANKGRGAIDRRLSELDAEWDIERLLEANAAGFSLAGLLLGFTVHKRFYLLPAVVAGFLAQHAIQGWCPPLSVFRRMGVRTRTEIDQERYALKALRGDFAEVSSASTDGETASSAYQQARL